MSRFVTRALPAIMDCGIWPHLAATAHIPTRALVTDIGNDILYGFPPEQTLAWIEEAIVRLQQYTGDIVLTGLPMASIRRVSPVKFKIFCSILAPSCRLALRDVVDRAEVVHAGLATLAERCHARFLPVDPSWYGVDPVHIQRRYWRDAWQRILGTDVRLRAAPVESLRLYAMRAECESWFGRQRHTPQTGRAFATGARVWLY